MLILNDIHIGAVRKGGTTPASQAAMRQYLFGSLDKMMKSTDQSHVVILGDLFDTFEVPSRDLLDTYMIFAGWLGTSKDSMPRSGGGPGRVLTLIAGNHDISAKAMKVSSFSVLSEVLRSCHPDRVQLVNIDEIAKVTSDVWAVAHCSNQETFDAKLLEVLAAAKPGDRVLIHANFDNNFAAQSDHSLNVSRDQAYKFTDNGLSLIFGHEHQAKTDFKGKVQILGNQWPTSISDCLNNDAKFAHVLGPDGLDRVVSWSATGEAGFAEVDWRELEANAIVNTVGFIRVVGDAEASEAADVMNAIASFRKVSSAFVISNAVKIAGVADNEALAADFEATKAFDVLEFIKKHLDEDEMAVVQSLVGEAQ